METHKVSCPSSPSFNLINEKNNSPISLSLQKENNQLIILAKVDSEPDKKYYITSFNFNSLYKLHKIFKIFETIDEVIEFISQLIQNKESKIYSSEKDELIFELNVSIGIKKEQIKINLHRKNINLEETVFQLTQKVEEMQMDIKKLKLAVFGEEKNENEKE